MKNRFEVRRITGNFLYVVLTCNILSWSFTHKNCGAFFILAGMSKSNTADDIINKSRALLVARQKKMGQDNSPYQAVIVGSRPLTNIFAACLLVDGARAWTPSRRRYLRMKWTVA